MSPERERWALAAIIALHIGLASAVAWINPAWEAPDEPWHLGYVTWLKEHRRLPPLSPDILDTWVQQEASQPPLYYVLAALASSPFDTGGMDEAYRENPGRWGGVGLDSRNHNYALHGPWDAPGRTPLTRGLLAARWVATLMGAVAVWVTWRLARSVTPGRPDASPVVALGAAGILAFTPQFVFLAGAASNDTTAAAMCTLALWRAAELLRAPGGRNAGWLGVAIGLAVLSKGSALALVVAGVGVALIAAWRVAERPGWVRAGRRGARWAFGVLGTATVVGGWWYARNLLAYGTLYGRELHLAMPWAREVPADVMQLLADGEPWVLFISYWAAFGWGTIRYPVVLYWIALVACALAVVGLGLVGLRVIRRARRTGGWSHALRDPDVLTFLLLAGWTLVIGGALSSWMTVVRAHWGRLLFPAAGTISILLSVGLDALRPRAGIPWLATGLLLVWSATIPTIALPSALHPPAPDAAARKLQAEPSVGWQMGSVAELLAFEPERLRTPVDAAWPVQLCWNPLRQTDRDYRVLVHLVAPDDRLVASYHSIPGDGTNPTTAWAPGEPFCNRIDVLVEEDVPAPAVYRVAVGLFDPETDRRLPIVGADGDPLPGGFITSVKVEPSASGNWPSPTPERPLDPPALFADPDDPPPAAGGGVIALEGFGLPEGSRTCAGAALPVRLVWSARGEPGGDYQVLLHMVPAAHAGGGTADPIVQGDGPVQQPDARGPYPTSLWTPGERIADTRVLQVDRDVAPGRYRIKAGMYRLSDLRRLPVRRGADVPEERAVTLSTPIIVERCAATEP